MSEIVITRGFVTQALQIEPLSLWRLDSSAADAKGVSDGAFTGSPELGQLPLWNTVGESVGFDGLNDGLTIPHVNAYGLVDWAIHLKVQPDTTPLVDDHRVLFAKGANLAEAEISIRQLSTGLNAYITVSGVREWQDDTPTGLVALTPGVAHDVLFQGTPQGTELWHRPSGGVWSLVGSRSIIAPELDANTGDIYVGHSPYDGFQFDGLIDDVAIYAQTLGAGERDLIPTPISRTHPRPTYTDVVEGIANLLAYWKLAEESGTTLADSAGTRNATVLGGIPQFEVINLPKVAENTAIDFAGRAYGEVPHDSGLLLSAFTLSFWLKLNRLPTSEEGRFALISKDLTGLNEGDATIWVDDSGGLTFQFQSASTQFPLTIAAGIVAGERYHIAARADSTGFDLTMNAEILGKSTDYTAAWSLQAASQPLRFGAVEWLFVDDPATPGTWPDDAVLLDGVLDEIALYARALTDAEILELSQYDTPPVANNDSFVVQEQTTTAFDVVANDTFVGQKSDLTVEIVTPPSLGSASIRADNDVDYSAGAVDQQESDSFTYKITDAIDESTVATASITINDQTAPGSGDGLGGDLVYVFQPQLAWIEGVPLADRSHDNCLNLTRFTDSDATAGSSLLPFSDGIGGGGSTKECCFTRAPTAHPALEVKNSTGHNSGGIDYDIRFWNESAGIRHVRVVMEMRVSHPNDPTTYQSEGLYAGEGTWPNWFDTIQSGGKLMIGLHCNRAGASCKYNWYAKPDFPTTNATYRIGWGSPIGGTDPGFRAIMPLEIGWNRPFACEVGPIEPAQSEDTRISTLGERWSRLELELKLCSPSGTPTNATEGNTGFGGDDGTSSDPGPGDGFTKVFITRDVDGELGSPGSRVLISHVRGTVSFPRPDQHLAQSIREILFTMWYGGTGSSSYPLDSSPVWVRKVEMYHYTEDDI